MRAGGGIGKRRAASIVYYGRGAHRWCATDKLYRFISTDIPLETPK